MIDPITALKQLNRPTLLVTAARLAGASYDRDRDLQKLLKFSSPPGRNQSILRLMELESELENCRRTKDPVYSATRHVKVLTALMHEAQHPRPKRCRQVKASATSAFLRSI